MGKKGVLKVSRQLGFLTSPRSYAEIEGIAAQARSALVSDREPTEALPGVILFEQLDGYCLGHGVSIDYQVKPLPTGVEALTKYEPDEREMVITLATETYQALEEEERRARLTLGHEIGHTALHYDLLIKLAEIPHREASLMRGNWPEFPLYRDSEWQADAFASALLAPAEGLAILEKRSRLSSMRISETFGMSRKAAEVRLRVYSQRKDELLKAIVKMNGT